MEDLKLFGYVHFYYDKNLLLGICGTDRDFLLTCFKDFYVRCNLPVEEKNKLLKDIVHEKVDCNYMDYRYKGVVYEEVKKH